jgi:DNA polymerase-3 subunit delta'
LLATIKSRCQQLAFPVPQDTSVQAWLSDYLQDAAKAAVALKEASGRPIEALRLIDSGALAQREKMAVQLSLLLAGKQSAVGLAEQWKDEDFVALFEWLQQRLTAMIRYCFAAEAIEQPWDGFANRAGKGMYALLDKVNASRLLVLGGSNPNRQLLLEDILLSFCAYFAAQ